MSEQSRRRLIVYPRFQCAQLGAIVITFLMATAAYVGILAWVFYEILVLGEAMQLPQSHFYFDAVATLKSSVKVGLVTVFAGFLALVVYGGLVRTRRVAGPVKSLIRHLNELADGGPVSTSLRFRRDDCFHELATSFNDFREAEHAQRRSRD